MCHFGNYTESKGELITELREVCFKYEARSLTASEVSVKCDEVLKRPGRPSVVWATVCTSF